MNTPKAVTVDLCIDYLRAKCVFEPENVFNAEILSTLQKLQAAREALKAGAMCLEATALSHRHPSMSKGATTTDLNDAMRAGNKASDDKLLHAAALWALGE